jgi:serine/threonine protein kinase
MAEQLIGNYRVLKKIGVGGMAQVYLAVHRDVPNLKVILKILSDPRLAERFKQEADKLALLDGHSNICRIKHFFNHGDDTVIAMEYIEGETLEEKLKRTGRLSVAESLKIVHEVLGILDFAHHKGISHRDIKPSNIMIDNTGQVKIIDFGIAKGESDPNLTIAGTACGTPAYMAPEQFTPAGDTNYNLVDVYATGTTLFHMLTGDLPFKGDNEFAIRDAKLYSEPVKPRTVVPNISKQLEGIILKAIEKDPQKRFQSTQQMSDALADLLEGYPEAKEATGEMDVGVPVANGRSPRRVSGKPPYKRIIPVVLVIAVLGVLAYRLFFYGSEPGQPEKGRLLSPADGEVLTESRRPVLEWAANAGPGGRYVLEYASDSDFSDSKTLLRFASVDTLPNELENGTYYWRVYVMNEDGVRGEPSAPYLFVIDVPRATIPEGKLTINVRPAGDIYVDDELLARNKAAATTILDTGTHVIRVENSDSREKVRRDTLRITEDADVQRSYSFSFPPAPPEEIEVRVGSMPRGASVYIDGELQAHKTNYAFMLKKGTHIIRASLRIADSELEMADTLVITADSTHKVFFDFEQ